MHRTIGDSYGTESGKNIFRQESPGTYDATQVTYDSMNALQEEIANVITAEGYSLNAASEGISEMIQLNTAINKKVSDEATARDAAIVAKVPDATHYTSVSGQSFWTNVGALTLAGGFHAHLQKLATPHLAVVSVHMRIPADVSAYNWVAWELPTAFRPAYQAAQPSGVVPAMGILYDTSETPEQSDMPIKLYAAAMRATISASVRNVVMFSGAELLSENFDDLPASTVFPLKSTGDFHYVGASFLYDLNS